MIFKSCGRAADLPYITVMIIHVFMLRLMPYEIIVEVRYWSKKLGKVIQTTLTL